MKNISIRKCVRKDGTIDVLKIEGRNPVAKIKKTLQSKPRSSAKIKAETDKAVKFSNRIDFETGAVIRNSKSLHKTMKNGREKIRYNVVNRQKNCLMYRLGYYPHYTNINRASDDFKRFIRQLRKKYEPIFGRINYCNVLDLHEDMSIHFHGIFYAPTTKKLLRIDHAELEKLWGHGTIYLQHPKRNTPFDYLFPMPTKSNSKKALHYREKFCNYLLLPEYVKIARFGGFENPVFQNITLEEYEELKETRQLHSKPRKHSYDYLGNKVSNDKKYGHGVVTYTYETFKK